MEVFVVTLILCNSMDCHNNYISFLVYGTTKIYTFHKRSKCILSSVVTQNKGYPKGPSLPTKNNT